MPKKKLQIKAIPTFYSGIRFRSRIEARWALFYDEIGVQWEYEKEGFDLGKELGWYVPDFYLHELDIWIEIKGSIPTVKEARKLEAVAAGTSKKVCLFYGPIPSFYVGIEEREDFLLGVSGLILEDDLDLVNEDLIIIQSEDKQSVWMPAYWTESTCCGPHVASMEEVGSYPFCGNCPGFDPTTGYPSDSGITPKIVAGLLKARVWDFTHAGEAE